MTNRIRFVWNIWRKCRLPCNKTVPELLKSNIYKTAIIGAYVQLHMVGNGGLFGHYEQNQLKATQMKMLISTQMKARTYHFRNATIRQSVHLKHINISLAKKTLSWSGHVYEEMMRM